MEKITYKNKYGHLEFEVGSYQEIRTISSKTIPDDLFFEIGVAEQIALITGNRKVQLSVSSNLKKMYLVHHKTSSVVAICKITKLKFNSSFNATKELDKPNYFYGPMAIL